MPLWPRGPRLSPGASTQLCVVLGNQVYASGEPSPRLRARLERALALYRQGLCPRVLVSGAVGHEGVDEAVAMSGYLLERGVPDSNLLVDSQGRTTWATARNTAALMRELQLERVTVVSQYFHLTRSKLALRRAGAVHVQAAAPDYFEWRDLYSVPREVVAVYAYLLRGI